MFDICTMILWISQACGEDSARPQKRESHCSTMLDKGLLLSSIDKGLEFLSDITCFAYAAHHFLLWDK